jgi:hypothetical protein
MARLTLDRRGRDFVVAGLESNGQSLKVEVEGSQRKDRKGRVAGTKQRYTASARRSRRRREEGENNDRAYRRQFY